MTPDPKIITESADYVSPTSDETLRERYERVKADEAAMTEEEIQKKITQLEEPSHLFDWEENQ